MNNIYIDISNGKKFELSVIFLHKTQSIIKIELFLDPYFKIDFASQKFLWRNAWPNTKNQKKLLYQDEYSQ